MNWLSCIYTYIGVCHIIFRESFMSLATTQATRIVRLILVCGLKRIYVS